MMTTHGSVAKSMRETIERLRQRVEELEEAAGKMLVSAQADLNPWIKRAEAAESENEELRAKLVGMLERAAKAEAEVERLRGFRYADDLGIALDAAGLSTRCRELRDRLLAQSAEMKNALEAIEMLQATLVARDETVERLRGAGDRLARALDGTRYAMEERKVWVAALAPAQPEATDGHWPDVNVGNPAQPEEGKR